MTYKNTRHSAKLLNSTALGRSFSKGKLAAGLIAASGALALAAPQQAQAFQLYNGPQYGNNIIINLATTISWTPIWRTNNPSAVLTNPETTANTNEGDINFPHGLVSDEFEILPVLDIKDGNYGAHFSGEAYLNTSYLSPNKNDQPNTLNAYSVAKNTDFTSATRNIEGLNARMLDTFAYGRQYFGANNSQSITLKVGRQTLLWGQSFLLTGNGIVAGMAPDDALTAQNTPNAEVQQIVLPVAQAVVTYQPNNVVTLQGYYQFEWAPDNFQGVGAFFNGTDFFDKGGERLIEVVPNPAFPSGFYAYRGHDLRPPSSNGQFGASVQLTLSGVDVGFYALRYDAKIPTFYLSPTDTAYNLVYPRDIWIEGSSLSTIVGASQVAGEFSFRQHMPLASGFEQQTAANPGNANSHPLYPYGTTVAGQASIWYTSPSLPLLPGGFTFLGETGFNHVLSVTANKDEITPGTSSTGVLAAATLTPQWLDVIPYLNLSAPIGINYNIYGRSQFAPGENHGTGDFNVGLTATYRVNWVASVTFTDNLGAPSVAWNGLADRNNIELNVQHTF